MFIKSLCPVVKRRHAARERVSDWISSPLVTGRSTSMSDRKVIKDFSAPLYSFALLRTGK
jgi:hypothetical protein